ncbi:MAG: AAA family ATPase [Patescibacteria group bacterium]
MPYLEYAVGAIVVAVIAYVYIAKYRQDKAAKPAAGPSAFTQDLTERARLGKLEPVIGMEDVIERLIHVIARKTKNNPLIIGEPGVGKTAVVEGLAQRIVKGEVPEAFKGKTLLSLSLADLMSGTKYRGELEKRLREFLQGLEDKPRQYILFIDEIHMLEQARGSEGSLDIADIFKPALSRGELQIIGATTWREYEKYLKPDQAIDRRFQPVLVEEPSRETAIRILGGVKETYEKFHDVCIPQETLEAAVDASMKFIHDRFLPDKAFDVIDEACAKVSIESSRPHAAALGLIHAASAKAKVECALESKIVTPQDVADVAEQWHTHRTKPVG